MAEYQIAFGNFNDLSAIVRLSRVIARYTTVLVLCALLLPKLAAAALAASMGDDKVVVQGLHMEGYVEGRGSTNGQMLQSIRSSRFSVDISGCSFRIVEKTEQPASTNSFHYDGTNYYSVTWSPSSQLVTQVTKFTARGEPILVPLKKPMPVSPATMWVSPIVEPLLPYSAFVPLWLAFGSRCHFEAQISPMIPPLWMMVGGGRYSSQNVKADRDMIKGRLFISSYTDYGSDEFFPQPEPECAGRTNIACWITGWTNVGSVVVPQGFKFVRFFFNPSGNPKYYQSTELVAKVDKVSALKDVPSFTPTILTNTYIVHHSSSDNYQYLNPFSYRARDGRLKSQEEVDEAVFGGPKRPLGLK